MVRKLCLAVALLGTAVAVSGCYVAPAPGPVVARPGCRWVPGHYGYWGRWHPGHCA